MIRDLQGSVQHLLARSSLATRLAVKFRNQASYVIGYHLGETIDANINGEFALIRQLAPQIHRFIDVGANVGAWSECVLAQTRAQGHIFEPSSQCFTVLEKKFTAPGLVLRNVAVSNTTGIAEFAEEDDCGELSSLVDSRNLQQGAKVRKVEVVTLDDELGAVEGPIDFLKIDTEGYDLNVLRGAAGLLERTRFVQFEYNTFWVFTGASLAQAMSYLGNIGFALFLIRSTGLHPFRYEVWKDYFRYSNFFACRKNDLDAVAPLLREPI